MPLILQILLYCIVLVVLLFFLVFACIMLVESVVTHVRDKLKGRGFYKKDEIEWIIKSTYTNAGLFVHQTLSNTYLERDCIMYLESSYNQVCNEYIAQNHDNLVSEFKKKGFKFVYLPKSIATINHQNDIAYIRFKYPLLHNLSDTEILEIYAQSTAQSNLQAMYDAIIQSLDLPTLAFPILIKPHNGNMTNHAVFTKYDNQNKFRGERFREFRDKNIDDKIYFKYEIMQFDTSGLLPEINEKLKLYLHFLWKYDNLEHGEFMFQKVLRADGKNKPRDYFLEDEFNNKNGLLPELKTQIDTLFANNESHIVADAMVYMLLQMKNHKPEILNKLQPFIEKNKLQNIDQNVYISKLYITNPILSLLLL